MNATPLAVTSTLFLFFVESRLAAPGWEGPLLVLFFLVGGGLAGGVEPARRRASAPSGCCWRRWSWPSCRFAGALTLGPGDVAAFAVICVLSGATIGADLTLLPAAFARRMAEISPKGGQGFGLWSLVNKATLAVAAALLLPLLGAAGFQPGAAGSPDEALALLSLLYAGVPFALKLGAVALLASTRLDG